MDAFAWAEEVTGELKAEFSSSTCSYAGRKASSPNNGM